MANFVLDSYALLTFFRNEEGADAMEKLLHEAAENKHELYIPVVNAGEVYYMSYRKDGNAKAEKVWEAMLRFPLQFVEADLANSLEAAKIKARFKISFADAFAAALAIKKKATLITGDHEFESLTGETNFKVKYL